MALSVSKYFCFTPSAAIIETILEKVCLALVSRSVVVRDCRRYFCEKMLQASRDQLSGYSASEHS
jgi:hypothetical protein